MALVIGTTGAADGTDAGVRDVNVILTEVATRGRGGRSTKVERGTTVLYGKKLSGTTVLQLRYHRSERDAEKCVRYHCSGKCFLPGPLFWKKPFF